VRTVEEQLALVTAAAVAPRPVRVAISEAQGLLCAEEVVAERPLPSFDQAAIDGYAVRAVDVRVPGAAADPDEGPEGPTALPVVGQITAGSRQPARLQPGQCVRVDTGAPLPTLADAVLPVGWATVRHGRLHSPEALVKHRGAVERSGFHGVLSTGLDFGGEHALRRIGDEWLLVLGSGGSVGSLEFLGAKPPQCLPGPEAVPIREVPERPASRCRR